MWMKVFRWNVPITIIWDSTSVNYKLWAEYYRLSLKRVLMEKMILFLYIFPIRFFLAFLYGCRFEISSSGKHVDGLPPVSCSGAGYGWSAVSSRSNKFGQQTNKESALHRFSYALVWKQMLQVSPQRNMWIKGMTRNRPGDYHFVASI